MKQRPILFNTDMVRAILDGRKTQTRRPISIALKDGWDVEVNEYGSPLKGRITSHHQKKDRFGVFIERNSIDGRTEKDLIPCPFGQPGDQLWVRETYYIPGGYLNIFEIDEIRNGISSPQQLGVIYRADNHSLNPSDGGWKPSIHMSRWASRITLEITNVRVERVQDITEADAIAEGVQPNCCLQDHTGCDHGGEWFLYTDDDLAPDVPAFSAKESFASLWGYINGPKAWDRNDWVWVIEFKRIDGANQ